MCHHCVVESVKRRMLSRRDIFKVTAAGAAAAAVGTAAGASPALAAGTGQVEDMTHELHPAFPTYFGESQFATEEKFSFDKNGFNLSVITVNEHTGTHVDAPLHFSKDGQSVAEIPVANLVVPLAVVDIRAKASADPDAQVTPEDIKAWIASNGPLPDKCCVAMNSGWDKHAATDKFRNVGADKKMHFPGFHPEATKMLMEESSAVGMAVDTLSLDFGQSGDFATHYAWLPSNRWGVECIANLDKVPAKGATLVVGAPKHRGGSGGPARVFALV
ncbi:cyclase family protein [Thalassobaculum sp.]|uniref:cyclase family protein n=1 Tax=Thalassobaculum sp. TaxID=2022740 RepID=UPI0032EC22D7